MEVVPLEYTYMRKSLASPKRPVKIIKLKIQRPYLAMLSKGVRIALARHPITLMRKEIAGQYRNTLCGK